MCLSKDRGVVKSQQVYKTLPQSTFVLSEIVVGDPGPTEPVVWYVVKMTQDEFKRLLEKAPFLARAVDEA